MATKQLNSRIVLKHDTAANWKTAGEKGFCPLANEIIMFDPDDSCAMIRYKIGRWANEEKTELVNINNLPFESNVYVGRDEPVNAPAGFIWVDTSEDVELGSFIFRNWAGSGEPTVYYFEIGMTWREFIQSSYNIDSVFQPSAYSEPIVHYFVTSEYGNWYDTCFYSSGDGGWLYLDEPIINNSECYCGGGR